MELSELNQPILLVVDVQVGAFDGRKTNPIEDSEFFLSNLVNILAIFRERKLPIVYIQDCGKIGGAFEKGKPQWEIHPKICPLPEELVVFKEDSDAFSNNALIEYLSECLTEEIIICGLHSEGCVKATGLSAKSRGFRTIIAKGIHARNPTSFNSIEQINEEFLRLGLEVESILG